MATDPVLGHLMNGNQLPRLPANPSMDDLVTALNSIIDTLNNSNKDIVLSGETELLLKAGESVMILPVAHNLNYKPRPSAYLDDITDTIDGISYPHLNLPLPSWLNGATDGSGHFLFTDWVNVLVDTVNIYFIWVSGVTYIADQTFNVKWFLTREAANAPS